ncbi:unnamed protein product [Leptidea sinapis]|uniref:Uncharacterized protein n=1 Tax=Leptidea sinapis TaxID=189913 RepID=A0A5E4Q4C3_9NEOP|nr:unnamed protein product [Leptidea sinapis]
MEQLSRLAGDENESNKTKQPQKKKKQKHLIPKKTKNLTKIISFNFVFAEEAEHNISEHKKFSFFNSFGIFLNRNSCNYTSEHV